MCLGAKKQREIKTCLKFDGIRVMLLLLPRHDWTSAMKTTRVNDTKETWRVRVFVCCVACACVCTPYTVHSVPLFAVVDKFYASFSHLPFRLNVRPARLLVLWCWWWRRRHQQQQRRQRRWWRRQWEMMKSQTEVLATQAYNNTTTIINTATQKWYESRIHISYVILVDCSGSVLPSLFLVYTSWSFAVREMMPPKLEVNTQCVVRVCMCVRACYYMRFETWQCVSARSTGHRAATEEEDDEEKKKRKKQHINESSVAGGSKASQVYDLHPPLLLMTKKDLCSSWACTQYTHTYTAR